MNMKPDLGESYMYGAASAADERYAINIPGGARGLALPKVLHQRSHSKIVQARFTTEAGKSVKLEMPTKVGGERIEIYDNGLLLETGRNGDIPVAIDLAATDEKTTLSIDRCVTCRTSNELLLEYNQTLFFGDDKSLRKANH